ncbi:hypothetical protein [Pantoea sp.]|uniref:hypothetical protein n=1 Tax=Pantoea sp. TaxID=69393 RepID=UPI00290C768C|nr:hypothetical protein [Pantoea sp.]MDU5473772.1 hypothetical protein [Pantoea sp.]
MAITDLNILQSSDAGSMVRLVTDAIANGWQPMGYLRITNGTQKDFYQTMYKGANVDVNPYQAIIANNQQLTVKNSAGTMQATGTVAISQSAVTAVTIPATTALVNNTQALNIPVTTGLAISLGTATRTVTLTVSGGVVTAASIS